MNLIKVGVIFGMKVQKLGIQKIRIQNVEINAKGAEVARVARGKRVFGFRIVFLKSERNSAVKRGE